jgi:hypothetical protein
MPNHILKRTQGKEALNAFETELLDDEFVLVS